MTLALEAAQPEVRVVTKVGDARDLAGEYRSRRFDLILTDPAYPSLERHREAGGSTVRLKDWFETLDHNAIIGTLAQLASNLNSGCFALVMSDMASAYELALADGVRIAGMTGSGAPVGEATGLLWRTPWVWEKVREDDAPSMGMGYYGRGAYELVLVLQKPGRVHPATAQVLRCTPNVVRARRIRGGYPTEKPLALADGLIEAFAPKGRWLLDPFAGSGWAGRAAVKRGMSAELWDLSAEAPAHTRDDWPEGVEVARYDIPF